MDYEFDFVFSEPMQCGDGWLHTECSVECCASYVGDDDCFDLDALQFKSHGGVGGAHKGKWMPIPFGHALNDDLRTYLDTPEMKYEIAEAWKRHRADLRTEAAAKRFQYAEA